jgi:hypothetical protein
VPYLVELTDMQLVVKPQKPRLLTTMNPTYYPVNFPVETYFCLDDLLYTDEEIDEALDDFGKFSA